MVYPPEWPRTAVPRSRPQLIVPRTAPEGKSVRVVEYSAAVWSDDAQPVLSGKRFQLPLHLLAVAAVIFRKAAGVDDEVVHAALCRVVDESVYRRCRSRDQHKLRNLRQFRQQRISPDTEYFTFALVDEIKPQLLLTFYKAFRRVAAERAGAVARADERDALWFEQLVQHILASCFSSRYRIPPAPRPYQRHDRTAPPAVRFLPFFPAAPGGASLPGQSSYTPRENRRRPD